MNTRATLKTTNDAATRDSARTARGATERAGLPEQVRARPKLESGATPLPQPMRDELGARFGQNFETVRLHRGAQAEASADALGARAYTVGNDIVLGASAPPLDTYDGRKLLAHETAHVVQQRRGGPPPALDSDAPHEQGAGHAADAFVNGAQSIDAGAGTGTGIARVDEDPKKKKPSPVTAETDADVEQSFVEEPTKQGEPNRIRPRSAPPTKEFEAARVDFENKKRDKYAEKLKVGKYGQVHHGIELQVLNRYPGVFTGEQLNSFSNMRGIKPEDDGKTQLHNSKIRDTWDYHYVKLDSEIKKAGLTPGTHEHTRFVQKYLLAARNGMDKIFAPHYSDTWYKETGKVAQAKPRQSKGSKAGANTPGTSSATGKPLAANPVANKKAAKSPAGSAQGKSKAAVANTSAPASKQGATAKNPAAKMAGAAAAAPNKAPAAKSATNMNSAKPSAAGAQGTSSPGAKAASAATMKPASSGNAPVSAGSKAAVQPSAPASKAPANKSPAVKAPSKPTLGGKPPPGGASLGKPSGLTSLPKLGGAFTSGSTVTGGAARTSLPNKTSGAASPAKQNSKPSRFSAMPSGNRAGMQRGGGSRGRGRGKGGGGNWGGGGGGPSVADGVFRLLAVPAINSYLQKQFAEEVRTADNRLRSDAIESHSQAIEAAIEANRVKIEHAQMEGKEVRVSVTLDTISNDPVAQNGVSVTGPMLVSAEVVRAEVLIEGEDATPHAPKEQTLAQHWQQFNPGAERHDIVLENEAAREFHERMSKVERARGDKGVEDLIVRSLKGEVSQDDVRAYAAHKRELAEGSKNSAAAPNSTSDWNQMEALMDGPLDEFIAHAKQKGIALESLREHAAAMQHVSTVSDPLDVFAGFREQQYWSEVVKLIDKK